MTTSSTTSGSRADSASWRRHVLGCSALVLFAGGVAFWFYPADQAWQQELQSACWKLGPLLAVFWLAYEQLRRLPILIWWSMPVLLWVLAFRPRWLLVLIPILIAWAILMPRRRPRR
jgi:hypothetical protein